MKKIWIDGYEANVPQRLGSGQVAYQLLKNIEKLDQENDYTILLQSKPFNDLPKERINWKYKILRPAKLWTRLIVPVSYFFSKTKPDVIFSPTHYVPAFIKVPKVSIIFDLSFLRFPDMYKKDDMYKLTKWTEQTAKDSSAIITISESSKNDIIKFYGTAPKKITVSYPGYDSDLYKKNDDSLKVGKIKSKYGIEGDYVIFIGTVQPRKNLMRLIRAMKTIENCRLVIVGKISGKGRKAWMNEAILSEPKKLGIEEKIVFTNFAPDEDLPYLITGAKAFVLPSLWEGFGIPVAEAMACGVPVIVSNNSSLPEVAGEAGILVNPESETQIEQAIRLVITDKKLQIKLSSKALVQAKKFSWEKMARDVISVLESV